MLTECMIAPWYYRAYERLEREIKTSLEQIAGDASHVKETKREIEPLMIVEYNFSIFEVYDIDNNLAAKVSLGNIPTDTKQKPIFESKDTLNLQVYHPEFTPALKLKPLEQKIGNVEEKVEQYAQEYCDLCKQLGDAVHQTILLTSIKDYESLKPYAQKLLKSGRKIVIQFYQEAKWNSKGIAEAFGVSEQDIKNVVEQIRAQLPQTYLELEKQLDEF